MFDHSNVVKLDSTTFKEKVRTRLQYLATEAFRISTVLIISASSETQRRITVWLLHHNACANVLFLLLCLLLLYGVRECLPMVSMVS
jgi:hypothetical protein